MSLYYNTNEEAVIEKTPDPSASDDGVIKFLSLPSIEDGDVTKYEMKVSITFTFESCELLDDETPESCELRY